MDWLAAHARTHPGCLLLLGRFSVVRRGQTIHPVTIKDQGDEAPVCYCFDFKRADIRRELIQRGKTDIPAQIRKGIAEGRCACERTNPQGACCLGNVAAEIEKITLEAKSRGRLRRS